jgi:uncharacterized circularly permuted ATP-grasp superfamily protein
MIQHDPRNFIVQPTLALSRAPCFIDARVQPRHVDLRPYVLYGDSVTSTTVKSTRSSAKISMATCRAFDGQCAAIHTAITQSYIAYPIESAIPA